MPDVRTRAPETEGSPCPDENAGTQGDPFETDTEDQEGMLEKEDYAEPGCVLCGKPGEEEQGQAVPIGRILEKLESYEAKDDTAGAERHLRYWLTEAETNRDRRGALTLHNELMGFYRKAGNRKQALAHAEKAQALVEALDLGQTITAGTTWVNIGTVREAFGEPEAGLAFFEKARENYERNLKPGDARLGGLYNNMALNLAALGRYAEARELFRKALEIMTAQENGELEQAITWLNLADAAEGELGAEAAESRISEYLERAETLLNAAHLPRNGYYAFVCDKCAPVFGYYGWFAEEAELRQRAAEIYGTN